MEFLRCYMHICRLIAELPEKLAEIPLSLFYKLCYNTNWTMLF